MSTTDDHILQAGDPLALTREHPEWSANVPINRKQKATMIALCLLLLAVTLWKPWGTARAFVLVSTVFYLVFTIYRLLLIRFSVRRSAEINVSPAECRAIPDKDLPVISVLVPMYHEGDTIGRLVKSLDDMDYPKDKKDIQLLLEEDDDETLAAVSTLTLPRGFRVTVVPDSFPKTKPKACNIGLQLAHGKYLVIYDAEDRPEPDQLRKVAFAFSHVPSDVACLQCRLNFYNPRQNLLTRWFTSEYSAWFDLSLPGLSSMNAVIPLGGTSNHFVTERLRELCGWDAYNVTEDCDLGVRIYRCGYRSVMLNTTTWEEACGNLYFWIRQRTRWLKGYIQTYMVHMRSPLALMRELGFRNFLHFQVLVGGIVIAFLLNPLFWFLALLWFVVRLDVLTNLFPGLVFAAGALCLFGGNFVFAYTAAIGCYKRRYYDLVKFAFLTPVYWVMMSYSGWRAFFQFFSDPFTWEKTQHGLSDNQEE